MNRSQISFFYILIVFCFGGCAYAGESDVQNAAPPNILFITIDDLGWADLACYGSDLHETPNIDKLALKSYKFTSSYSAAAICSPTRAALLSGKYPARLNFTTWSEDAARPTSGSNKEFSPPQTIQSLPHEEITIAEVLREKGYRTAHVGKWHIGEQTHYPETQGFDINVGASYWGAPPTFYYPYRGNYMQNDQYRYIGGLEKDDHGKYFTDRKDEYLTDRLTDEALIIIEAAGGQPFYLNLSYYSVHVPIEAKPASVEYFSKKNLKGLHHHNVEYAAMVKDMDENIGRVLNKLEELGIAENTLVVFISDNGGFINQYNNEVVTSNYPLRSGKGTFYEGGIRVPTLIYWPGITTSGKEIDVPISTIDFYPTLLDIANAPYDHSIDGVNLVPLLKEENATIKERSLFWHFPHYHRNTNPVSAVRDKDWKLIEHLDDDTLELYNLKDDIGEENNLIDAEPEKREELLKKLRNWKKEVNAQPIKPNSDFVQIK